MPQLNLLYLSFWGLQDGLTTSTILPHLRILQTFENIKSITVCTIERDGHQPDIPSGYDDKVNFIPLLKKRYKSTYLSKMTEFTELPKAIHKICIQKGINHILARGVNAGGIALNVHKKSNIPFTVESFEPHSDYMLESNAWKRYGLKYLFGNKWERDQQKMCKHIITVSENYRKRLIVEGVPIEKIFTIPCCVDLDRFNHSEISRKKVREKLGIADTTMVAVYVGKFGDIYYDKEAFSIIKCAFDYFGKDFYFIILSPQAKENIRLALEEKGIPASNFYIDCVPHEVIPEFLSAADFAISFVKPANCRKYCSPIKDGEYWAAGLPILMTENIGDDSDIVKTNPKSGYVFSPDFTDIIVGFKHVEQILQSNFRHEIVAVNREIARKYREFSIAEDVYKAIFNQH